MKLNPITLVSILFLLGACAVSVKKGEPESPIPAAEPVHQHDIPQPTDDEPEIVIVDSIDGKMEVAYKCGATGKIPLNVMYGFSHGEVVVAQVKFRDTVSPGLFRVASNKNANVFTGRGVTWVANKADAANVDKVDGNIFTIEMIDIVDGREQQILKVITSLCKLDQEATDKLNQVYQQKSPKRGNIVKAGCKQKKAVGNFTIGYI